MKFSGFTIEFHCLLIRCCLIRKPIIFIVRRKSTRGVKSVQRRLPATQHVSQLALTQLFGAQSSRFHAACHAAWRSQTVVKLVKQFRKVFSRSLHRQSFYGMLTRLILVSAREVHLFLIPAPLPARKWNFLFSSRWLSLHLNLEIDFEVNRAASIYPSLWVHDTNSHLRSVLDGMWWKRLRKEKKFDSKKLFSTLNVEKDCERDFYWFLRQRGVWVEYESVLSTELPWQHPDCRVNWVTTRQFQFSNKLASGIRLPKVS